MVMFGKMIKGAVSVSTEVKTADEINLFKVLIQNGKYKNNKTDSREKSIFNWSSMVNDIIILFHYLYFHHN